MARTMTERWADALVRAQEEGIAIRALKNAKTPDQIRYLATSGEQEYIVELNTVTGEWLCECEGCAKWNQPICKHRALALETIRLAAVDAAEAAEAAAIERRAERVYQAREWARNGSGKYGVINVGSGELPIYTIVDRANGATCLLRYARYNDACQACSKAIKYHRDAQIAWTVTPLERAATPTMIAGSGPLAALYN